jgi:hypothetical protein
MFAKKMMIATLASVFLIGTLPVEAGTFGKSSSNSSSGSRNSSSSFSSGNSNRSNSFGSSPSRNSSSNSTATNNSSNKGSISQGSSLGMSRSNVANNVKNGNYSAPANGTTVAGSNPNGNNRNSNNYGNNASYNNGNYNNGNYNNGYNGGYNNGSYGQNNQGHSTGTVVGAAAAGALAGYALGSHNNSNHGGTTVVVPNGNGGYNNAGNGSNGTAYSNNGNPGVVDNNGNYTTAPVGVAPTQASSSSGGIGSFFWTLIKIVIGLAILFFIVRFVMGLLNRRNSSTGTGFSPLGGTTPVFNSKTPEDEIRDMKEDFFVQFQDNNRPSGLDHIRQNSTPVFYNAVEDMVREQAENRTVKVRQLEAELVDLTQEGSRYIASVRYHAVVAESTNGGMQDSEVKELWNFVYENNRWKLAGIDQL